MILRIGFFRGLNVGGKNKLAMAALKSIFQDSESLSFLYGEGCQ